ncbi:MAG: molybdenum cofactor biosynthesis protein MoaE [Aquabacterium sp.]|jgi:molybdopterin synthase catalytic subunit|uniref:molybdenum cofactor biosynthesis protein MoaE n=1 Tax=Aquabacterium sp. TaxID=1872578 RepID=UPI003BB20532
MAGDTRPAAPHRHVAVQEADFDLGAEVAALREGDMGIGAVASFVGTVREWRGVPHMPADHGKPYTEAPTGPSLVLEHYPGMTERTIEAMVDEAIRRFELRGARVIHRVGPLALGDQIVLVCVSAPHRRAAFEGCEFLMDWLKTQAPFWKKEVSAQGSEWVDAREQDDAALARWGEVPDAVANMAQAGSTASMAAPDPRHQAAKEQGA